MSRGYDVQTLFGLICYLEPRGNSASSSKLYPQSVDIGPFIRGAFGQTCDACDTAEFVCGTLGLSNL